MISGFSGDYEFLSNDFQFYDTSITDLLKAEKTSDKNLMLGLLRFKFAPGTDLARKLMHLGNEMLVDTTDPENVLGELLMMVSYELRRDNLKQWLSKCFDGC